MPRKVNNKRLLIIDIESYLYKACAACKELAEISPFVYQELYKLENGIDYLDKAIKELMDILKADEFVLVLSHETNFRKTVYPEYKANRKGKPLMYPMLREYVTHKYPYECLIGLEADDVARIVNEDKINYDFGDKIIVSIDKDFYTIPCKFYRDLPDHRSVVNVDKEQAKYNLMMQTIMGDKTDNYTGIPGWGKSKTLRWLNEKPRGWADVLELYQQNGLTGTEYALNKTMAELVGYYQYDFEKGEVLYGK